MRSLSRVLTIGSALTSIVISTNTTWASQSSTLTLAQELSAINDIAPSYTYLATDPIQITDVSQGTSDMDQLLLGTATATSPIYWYADNSNNLLTTGVVGSAWKTFSGAPAASWNATTTESLTETTSNGSGAS